MALYPILIDAWQFECCGKPFAVGDTVGFPLELIDPARFADELRVELKGAAPAGAVRTDKGDALQLLRAGGLVVATAESGRTFGVLREQRHGGLPDSMPRTTGVAERLSIGRVDYVVEDDEWRPVPGTMTLRPVDRTPAAFDSSPDGKSPAWGEAGMIVHLRVD
jgi:hypothetical protein